MARRDRCAHRSPFLRAQQASRVVYSSRERRRGLPGAGSSLAPVRVDWQACASSSPPRVAARRPPDDACYAWARRRAVPAAAARPTPRLFEIEPGHARRSRTATGSRDPAARPTLVTLHGLEGSSDAHYMRGIADKAFRRGLQRRPAQPAELRRHRAPLGGALPLGADQRRAGRPR
ncbi:MAG: hypothetical protein M0C28_16425 [Candidatus Moduliflexus flocculans]|nr:hypothetical protein [Candidatus Moduliflexus flocculans]